MLIKKLYHIYKQDFWDHEFMNLCLKKVRCIQNYRENNHPKLSRFGSLLLNFKLLKKEKEEHWFFP